MSNCPSDEIDRETLLKNCNNKELVNIITSLTQQFNNTNRDLKTCNDKLSVCNANTFKIHKKHIEDINHINNTHKKEIDQIKQQSKDDLDNQRKRIDIECNEYVDKRQQDLHSNIVNECILELARRETDIRNQYNSELAKRETDIRNQYNSELANRMDLRNQYNSELANRMDLRD